MDLDDLNADIEDLYPHSDWTAGLKATFVALAEAEIRRRVRVRAMEVTDDAFSQSAQSTALPTGFIDMRSVSLNETNQRKLDYLTPDMLRSSRVWDSSGGPHAYTIEGDNLVVAPFESAVTLVLVYFKAFDALSAGSDTNWLLNNAYDVYLYLTLKHAAIAWLDPEAAAGYAAVADQAINNVNKEHRWSRIGNPIRRVGGFTP